MLDPSWTCELFAKSKSTNGFGMKRRWVGENIRISLFCSFSGCPLSPCESRFLGCAPGMASPHDGGLQWAAAACAFLPVRRPGSAGGLLACQWGRTCPKNTNSGKNLYVKWEGATRIEHFIKVRGFKGIEGINQYLGVEMPDEALPSHRCVPARG